MYPSTRTACVTPGKNNHNICNGIFLRVIYHQHKNKDHQSISANKHKKTLHMWLYSSQSIILSSSINIISQSVNAPMIIDLLWPFRSVLSSIYIWLLSYGIYQSSCMLSLPSSSSSLLASLHPSLSISLPPGSASPSPTRWPSLRVKAVFPAPLARQNVAVAEPVRTDLRHSKHRGESTYAQEELFFVRPSDFGKSRPLLLMEGRNVHVSTC